MRKPFLLLFFCWEGIQGIELEFGSVVGSEGESSLGMFAQKLPKTTPTQSRLVYLFNYFVSKSIFTQYYRILFCNVIRLCVFGIRPVRICVYVCEESALTLIKFN